MQGPHLQSLERSVTSLRHILLSVLLNQNIWLRNDSSKITYRKTKK